MRKSFAGGLESRSTPVCVLVLRSLVVRAANVRSWQLWDLVDSAGVLSQRISTAVLFAVLYVHLSAEAVDIPLLLAGNWLLIALAIVVAQWLGQPVSSAVLFVADPAEAMGTSLLLLLLLFLMAPVLHTLTRSVAEDSVISLAICLAVVHLAAFDYAASSKAASVAVAKQLQATSRRPAANFIAKVGSDDSTGIPVLTQATSAMAAPAVAAAAASSRPGSSLSAASPVKPASFSATPLGVVAGGPRGQRATPVGSVGALALGGATSLNAAVLASVMLASRLPGPSAVFALLAVAAQAFAVLPVCLARLRALSLAGHRASSVLLSLLTLLLLLTTLPSVVPGVVFVVVELCTVLLAPWLLIRMQSHKRQIQGPWDIATLTGLRH